MKKFFTPLLFAVLLIFGLNSCNKADQSLENTAEVSPEVLAKISKLGFSTQDVLREGDAYIVEGDIILHQEDLDQHPTSPQLIIAQEEQYRTNNLVSVTSAPRTITVRMVTSGGSKLPTTYIAALDEAIARYNAENLTIRFERVTSGGNIVIKKGNGNYLASAGFPSGGNPYNSVLVNSNFIGTNPNVNYLGTILAHELGHCIGFRHTDYMDRSFSCGGAYANEGASTVGAVHIPGTPTTADAGSWMLACIGSGQNRPFNSNDQIALDYLY